MDGCDVDQSVWIARHDGGISYPSMFVLDVSVPPVVDCATTTTRQQYYFRRRRTVADQCGLFRNIIVSSRDT